MSQTRRLAAILAADVAGYSRLMGADEEGTLGGLQALRASVIDPKMIGHRGRIPAPGLRLRWSVGAKPGGEPGTKTTADGTLEATTPHPRQYSDINFCTSPSGHPFSFSIEEMVRCVPW
jgi:class 3 adenylate cyclase